MEKQPGPSADPGHFTFYLIFHYSAPGPCFLLKNKERIMYNQSKRAIVEKPARVLSGIPNAPAGGFIQGELILRIPAVRHRTVCGAFTTGQKTERSGWRPAAATSADSGSGTPCRLPTAMRVSPPAPNCATTRPPSPFTSAGHANKSRLAGIGDSVQSGSGSTG